MALHSSKVHRAEVTTSRYLCFMQISSSSGGGPIHAHVPIHAHPRIYPKPAQLHNKLPVYMINLIIVSPTRSGDTMDSSSLSSASAEISC